MDRVKSVLDKILEAFKTNSIPKAIAYRQFPIPDIPCSKWSFLNQIVVALSGTEDARGFRQWLEVNRHVKKGTKGFDILVPWIKTTKEDEKEKSILKGFICKPVFRYEDTEGEDLAYRKIRLPELPLMEKAKNWGIDVKAIGGSEVYLGYYLPTLKEIGLATPEEKTFFHELSHYAHEQIIGELKMNQDPWQEIVAELSAQALCQIVGKTTDSQLGNSYEYIEHYSKKLSISPYTASMQVLNEVNQVLSLILKEENHV